jgi:hypothetical protein
MDRSLMEDDPELCPYRGSYEQVSGLLIKPQPIDCKALRRSSDAAHGLLCPIMGRDVAKPEASATTHFAD